MTECIYYLVFGMGYMMKIGLEEDKNYMVNFAQEMDMDY